MNVITKPDWLIYAEELREQLGRMNNPKSALQTERCVWDAYFKARHAKGYNGSLSDWYYLLRVRPQR